MFAGWAGHNRQNGDQLTRNNTDRQVLHNHGIKNCQTFGIIVQHENFANFNTTFITTSLQGALYSGGELCPQVVGNSQIWYFWSRNERLCSEV